MQLNYIELAKELARQQQLSYPEVSLNRLTDEYEALIKEKHSKKYFLCVKNTNNHLKKYISPSRPVRDIDVRTIEDFIVRRSKESPGGYEIDYRNIRAMFNTAVRWRYIETNIIPEIRPPKRQKEERVTMSKETMLQISDELRRKGKTVFADAVEWGFFTGMRGSEIINLQWKDINLSRGVVKVGNECYSTKTKKIREIPLSSRLMEILERRRGSNKGDCCMKGFVFHKKHKRYTLDALSKNFKKACRKLQLSESLKFHCLRHSACSYYLNEKKMSITAVKNLLGHHSIITTQLYSHASLEDIRRGMEEGAINNKENNKNRNRT